MKKTFDRIFPALRCGRESFWEKRFGGHISIGPLVVYGFNAMHVAINLKLGRDWVCLHPTMRVFGKWWPWYFYVSTDGTPCEATVKAGPGMYD